MRVRRLIVGLLSCLLLSDAAVAAPEPSPDPAPSRQDKPASMPPLAPSRHKSAVTKAPSGASSAPTKRIDDGYRIARPGANAGHTAPSTANPDSTRISRPGAFTPNSSGVTDSSSKPATHSEGKATATQKSAGESTSTADKSSQASDSYPAIGKLEQLTFGVARPDMPIEDRLVSLENAVFGKSYSHDSLFDRTERLKTTLLGKGAPSPLAQPSDLDVPPTGFVENPMGNAAPDAAELQYLDEIADREDSQKKAPREVLDSFALELINYERQRRGLGQLDTNHLAKKMAEEHVRDLVERGVTSHSNSKGDNPDKRYTLLGGVDAVTENLAVLSSPENGSKPTKSAVARILKNMLMQQDDREALLAPEASHIGFSMESMGDGNRLIACLEVVTNRGVINSVPKTVQLGDKVDVSGEIAAPYQFDRITLAWEGATDLPPQEEGGDEPLPYFPPLDYVAYREKSEKDHSKAIFALKTVGVLAAIAGGMFVPPVALAAPLIMMSGQDPTEPKPVSDIPIKGGVKVAGGSFNGKIPISNDGKEGLYYLTVWASLGTGEKPIAVSRRTIVAKSVHQEEEVSGDISIPKKTEDQSKPPVGEVAKEDVLKTDATKPAEASNEAKPVGDPATPVPAASASPFTPSIDAEASTDSALSTEKSSSSSESSKADSEVKTNGIDRTENSFSRANADSSIVPEKSLVGSGEANGEVKTNGSDSVKSAESAKSVEKVGIEKANGDVKTNNDSVRSAESAKPAEKVGLEAANSEVKVDGSDSAKKRDEAQADNKNVQNSNDFDATKSTLKNGEIPMKNEDSKDFAVAKTAGHSKSQITSSERETPSIEYTKGEDGNGGARDENSKTDSKEKSDDRD